MHHAVLTGHLEEGSGQIGWGPTDHLLASLTRAIHTTPSQASGVFPPQ